MKQIFHGFIDPGQSRIEVSWFCLINCTIVPIQSLVRGSRVELTGMPKSSRHEEELEASGASSAFSKDAAWNIESWRNFGFTPMDPAAVAAKAALLGARTSAASFSLNARPIIPTTEHGGALPLTLVASKNPTKKKKSKKQKASVNSAELSAQVSPTGSSFKKSAAAEQVNKQALDNALLTHFKRRIIDNPYVPGHCFFEAMAISAELTKGAGSCLGAVIARGILHQAYRDPNIQRALKNEMGLVNRERAPSFKIEVAQAEDRAAGRPAAELLSQSSELSHWHSAFFEERSFMMDREDCSQSTNNLWKYNIDVDTRAASLALVRSVVSMCSYSPIETHLIFV